MTDQDDGAATPGGYKVRLGFEIAGLVRPVVWFEPRGDDVYWGSSTPGRSPFAEQPLVNEDGRAEITIPRDFEGLVPHRSKYSYHASGQIHRTEDGAVTGEPGRVIKPAELEEPLAIGALITKRADCYIPGRSLGRGNAATLTVSLDEDTAKRRHYFEFYLSPEGTFDVPPMLLAPHITDPNIVFTQSMSPHLILVIRHAQCGDEFSQTEPEVEIWARLHGQPK